MERRRRREWLLHMGRREGARVPCTPHLDIHKVVCPRRVCPGLSRADVRVGERNRLRRVYAAAEVGARRDAGHLAPLLCAWPMPWLRDQVRHGHSPLRGDRAHCLQRERHS